MMQCFGTDQEVLHIALQWLEQGHELVLVTVLKTWGASPRPPGSLMLMRQDGTVSGSVSGGCVEADLVQRFTDQQLSERYPTIINYGVNRKEASRIALPCGARLELLLECLNDIKQVQRLLDSMQQQQLTARYVDLQTGLVSLEHARAEQDFVYTSKSVCKIFGPQWHMLLIGADHLSRYVSQMAQMLGYHVIVCEPRKQYANSWQLEGTELTVMMPDEAVQHYAQHPRSIVIALTHDPKLDDMALLDALASPAFYVGAIGSQANCAARRQRLKQLGISPLQLQRLHAPVGLSIGSHTPPEIALSIMAEITQLRNINNVQIKQSVSVL